jgi:NADH:ubiquinone oxidoreductase subunit K
MKNLDTADNGAFPFYSSGYINGIYYYEDILALLFIGNSIFFLGLLGLAIFRLSLLRILINLELSLLGVSLQAICYSFYFCDLRGQIAALVIMAVAGVESALGLAIFLSIYRLEGGISFNTVKNLHG